MLIAAAIVEALSSPTEYEGFQYLAAALIPILIWRNPRRPILLAYAALLAISTVGVLNAVSDLGAVLYKTSGTDFLTYESYAREVVFDHSLQGGSDVFFYQPGSRYLLGLMRVLFGDSDLLVTIWSMVGLSLPFVALIAWNRRRVQSRQTLVAIAIAGFLLLAVLNSPTTLAFVALAASEVPSWALLPLAVAAPQLRPSQQIAWIGSAAAAALIWVMRNNQALAVGAILAAIAVGIGRSRKRLLATAASVALAIALLPALHNLVYGGQLKFSTTSVDRVRQIEPSDLGQTLSNTEIGSQIRGHIAAIFYDPPTPGLTVPEFGWLLWGLLAVWVAAIALALLRLLRDREFPPIRWLLLVLPIAYLIPHVVYQVEVYYPRHIIAGYLAMGVCAIGAFAEMGVGRRNPRA